MIDINIYANFDILYLLDNLNVRYKELSLYELNVLLYFAQLLSIYDGKSVDEWGYIFTRNMFGAPLSTDVTNQADLLIKTGILASDKKDYMHIIHLNQPIESLSKLHMFSWRLKYIDASVTLAFSKTIPQISNALQNEPGIKYLQSLNRTSDLHRKSQDKMDDIFSDFQTVREIVPASDGVLAPASVWIDYLTLYG